MLVVLQYLQFIEALSRGLNMDAMTVDLGLDAAANAILARVDQVMKSEAASLQAYKTQIYNLQRKLKATKEQLDSKVLTERRLGNITPLI